MINIRAEKSEDDKAISALVQRAFTRQFGSGQDEVCLVKTLRTVSGFDRELALVAVEGDDVVGQVMFSPVVLGGAPDVKAVCLAPLCAAVGRQRQGVGTELVRQGLEACRKKDVAVIAVQGSREYYSRFGFRPIAEFGLETPFKSEHDMVLELVEGVLDGVVGTVRFPAEWGFLISGGDKY